MRRGERPLLTLPRPLLFGFLLLFSAQLVFHHADRIRLQTSYRPLAPPLEVSTYRALAMGSEQLLGYLMALRLQLHDTQVGKHFLYSQIDYPLLIDWLDHISDISAGTEYPMLLASRVYTATSNRQQLRLLLEFIERRFDDNPQLHWRRLVEASVIAKHRLADLELALRLAQKLARQSNWVVMPQWARDFEFLLLAEMNELETAIAIIQAMLATGSIKDPDELRFLQQKLSDFQQEASESQQSLQK
jgi:hypothetical protein